MSSHSYNEFDEYSDKTKGFRNIMIFVGLVALGAIVACLLTGCSPTKRMGGIAAKHPDAALKVCGSMYPPKTSVVTNTEYLPGQTTYLPGEVRTVDCDSARVAMGGAQTGSGKSTRVLVKVPCPGTSTRVDTVVRTVTNTIENTARVQLLTKERDEAIGKGDRLKQARNKWRWIGIGGLALLGVGIVLKIKNIV